MSNNISLTNLTEIIYAARDQVVAEGTGFIQGAVTNGGINGVSTGGTVTLNSYPKVLGATTGYLVSAATGPWFGGNVTATLVATASATLLTMWRVREGGVSAQAMPVCKRLTRLDRLVLSSSKWATSPKALISLPMSRPMN